MEISEIDEKKFATKLHRKFKKAINLYQLIPRGSRVVVAISGGKDSLCLLEMITRERFIKSQNIEVIAAHIEMENVPYRADTKFIANYCSERNVKLVIRKTSFDPDSDKRKSPCFLCSWQRRKILFGIAKENESNIIALGHHQDDLLETLLMNISFQGTISTMPPKLKMEKFDMTMIRPLCLITNEQLVNYSKFKNFPQMKKECPYEEGSFRSDIRKIINQLEELSPKARSTMYASMTNIKMDYLPKVGSDYEKDGK